MSRILFVKGLKTGKKEGVQDLDLQGYSTSNNNRLVGISHLFLRVNRNHDLPPKTFYNIFS
jgi:hypothetical protein